MKFKNSKLQIRFILTVVLIAVVTVGMTGCDLLDRIMEYLGPDFDVADSRLDSYDDFGPMGRISDDLPDRDFGGYEFTILSPDEARYIRDIYADELKGDIISGAVYQRNRAVEEKYNVKITGIFHDSPEAWARRSIVAGMDEFDLLALPMDMTAELAHQGLLLNFFEVPFIDFEKPWWPMWDRRTVNQQLSIMYRLYFAPNALLTSGKDATSVYVMNKNIIIDYGLENPYDLVMNGLWTADKMQEMARTVTVDINGDGIMSAVDRYGFLTSHNMLYASVNGSGGSAITKDENDMPFAHISELTLNAFNKWQHIYNDRSSAWTGDSTEIFEMFTSNCGLFMLMHIGEIPELRSNLQTDFGILPHPKLDTAQQNYYNPVDISGAVVSVPISHIDIGRTGIILEALSAESFYTLIPAYYDTLLMTAFHRDDESEVMLDIIFATQYFDLANIYGWIRDGDIFNGERIQTHIDRTIEMFKEFNY